MARIEANIVASAVATVICGHTFMLSANFYFWRSQGIRRMLSAFTKKYDYCFGHDIVGQLKHCKMCLHATKPLFVIAR